MRALFCHDHYYYRDGETILSRGQYHASVWGRYLNHFDGLTIIGRDGGKANVDEDGINQSSRDKVSFDLFPNMSSLKTKICGDKNTQSRIEKLVSDHDVIILRGTSELGALAFREAKRQGKIVAMEIVSCAFDELWFYGSLMAKLYAPYRFLKQRQLARHADAVIYVSQDVLQKRYPTRAPLIARASNVQIPDDAFLQKKIIQKNVYKIGLIGTLKNNLKGVSVAVEAMENIDNATLHILGPGDPAPFQKMIDDMGLSDRVFLDGIRESGDGVWQWLRDMDLYIQPSFQEGVPRAMIEAMAQGLPCIGSNAGGIPELIDDRWIVPRGHANALADKIQMMLADAEIMTSQGHRNFIKSQSYADKKLSSIRSDFWGNVVQMTKG